VTWINEQLYIFNLTELASTSLALSLLSLSESLSLKIIRSMMNEIENYTNIMNKIFNVFASNIARIGFYCFRFYPVPTHKDVAYPLFKLTLF
jgi:hypothetical protein